MCDLCNRIHDPKRSRDEIRVLSWVLEGLELGAESYGPLCVDTDPRNFLNEAAFEARDLLFYSAAQAIARRDAERAEVERELVVTVNTGHQDPVQSWDDEATGVHRRGGDK